MTDRSGALPFADRAGITRYLRGLAGQPNGTWSIAEAALALAALDRPNVDPERYHRHLEALARDVADEAASANDTAARIRALNRVVLDKYGYRGDTLTYEDVQNANLMRVIDRRKGLPVALGILYLHGGRAQGWTMSGLAFPGHFLVRIEAEGERVIIDPFHGGRVQGAAELRDLLKAITGGDTELTPAYYAAVPDREVLLRLQNNVKLRLLESGQAEKALAVIETMLLFAPDRADLLREHGFINAELGNLRAAIVSLERFLEREHDSGLRFATAAVVQDLKTRLQ